MGWLDFLKSKPKASNPRIDKLNDIIAKLDEPYRSIALRIARIHRCNSKVELIDTLVTLSKDKSNDKLARKLYVGTILSIKKVRLDSVR